MSDFQSHTVKPGTIMNFLNQQPKAIKIKIVTADGTEIESNLHPGASLTMTVQANVFLDESEEKYKNFEIIKDNGNT